MKVSQAVNYFIDYHKINSKKKIQQGIKYSYYPDSRVTSVTGNWNP